MSFVGVVLLILAPSIHAQTCGGRIELTPSQPTASFSAPNYPNPQTFTETACKWVFVAPNSESMTLNCPVISTKKRCFLNPIVYIQSGEREKLCGRRMNIERTTTADRFVFRYAFQSTRPSLTTGFTCTASASFDETPPTPAPPCSCGQENSVPRIIGGEEVTIHQFPWMVRLIISNAFLCGGSLISDEWILTAAHCVDGNTQASDIAVHLGDHDQNTIGETTNTITVQGIDLVVHPYWSSSTNDNDIALIKISPITFTREISPICLPFNARDISGKVGRVAGWGTTSSGGSTSAILLWVQLNLLTTQECRDSSSYSSSQITSNMICAEDSGKDSCQGDSGGPLFLKEDGYNFEVGIVSWGRECALDDFPGVYTRVKIYKYWIEDTTGETFCKSNISVPMTQYSQANLL